MYGPLELDARYYLGHHFKDDERTTSETSHGMRIEGTWHRWVLDQQRVEVSGWWDHDFSDGSDSVFVGIRFHFSRGRGYRDFRPSEVRFRALQEARMPVEPNNVINGVLDD